MSRPLSRDEIGRKAGRARNRPLPAYTDLGGYPIIYVTRGGDILCSACATLITDYDTVPNSAQDDPITAVDVYYEGPDENCASCRKPIPSAYGNPWEGK